MRITSLLKEGKNLVLGVISNEDSTDVTLASQLNKDFLKKRDDDEAEVSNRKHSDVHVLHELLTFAEHSI